MCLCLCLCLCISIVNKRDTHHHVELSGLDLILTNLAVGFYYFLMQIIDAKFKTNGDF